MPTDWSDAKTPFLYRLGAVAFACALLAGCPTASNPTKSSSSSSSAPSAGMPGGSPGAQMPGSGKPGAGESRAGTSETSTPGDVAGSSEAEGAQGDTAEAGLPGTEAAADSGSTGEPGFETTANGAASLPDLSDNPPPETASRRSATQNGSFETESSAQNIPEGESGGSGNTATQGETTGPAPPGGNAPMTPAEQVAILDAELERGTGTFDALILEQQAEQRRREQQGAAAASTPEPDSQPARAAAYEGGGLGGVSGGGSPKNPVKFPAPEDIPSGVDDDVVARQLREAAMREPDPAVREKLWNEYRKYKGIKQ